jgi:hypothetical protein
MFPIPLLKVRYAIPKAKDPTFIYNQNDNLYQFLGTLNFFTMKGTIISKAKLIFYVKKYATLIYYN